MKNDYSKILPLLLTVSCFLFSGEKGLAGVVVREIDSTHPPTTVHISVQPPPGTVAYAVEEAVPPGSVPMAIEVGGIHDRGAGKVKWGPFLDDEERIFTFRLIGEATGAAFFGSASFDGASTVETSGPDSSVLASPEGYFIGWQLSHFPEIATGFPYSKNHIMPGASTPLLVQYAMGVAPGSPGPALDVVAAEGQIELRYSRDTRRTDVTISIQQSADLSDWEEITEEGVEAIWLDENRKEVRIPANDEEPSLFFRAEARYEP